MFFLYDVQVVLAFFFHGQYHVHGQYGNNDVMVIPTAVMVVLVHCGDGIFW